MKTHYACVIKKCTIKTCDNWFVGETKSRYCDTHKKSQAVLIIGSNHIGKRSRFSREEIMEIRYLYLRWPVVRIAEHFNCKPSLIYRYIERDPLRYRES